MKLSLDWVKQYITLEYSPEEIASMRYINTSVIVSFAWSIMVVVCTSEISPKYALYSEVTVEGSGQQLEKIRLNPDNDR